MKIFWKRWLWLLFAFAHHSAFAAVRIDGFASPLTTGSDILGGVREVASGPPGPDIFLSIGDGELVYRDPNAVGSVSLAYYPNPDRIGFDLTQAGANNAFTLQVISVTGQWSFHSSHSSSEGSRSRWQGMVTSPGIFVMPFSEFLGNSDIRSVHNIILDFRPLTGGSIEFANLQATSVVPEPSTISLLALAGFIFLTVGGLKRSSKSPFHSPPRLVSTL